MEDFKDLPERPHNIYEIKTFRSDGPWNTKSKGLLSVLFSIPFDVLTEKFLKYDNKELSGIPEDIRGLRIYTVKDLNEGEVGGMEYHRIRQEIIFNLSGRTCWIFEDLFGKKREFNLYSGMGLWIPPFIMHTYKTMENKSGLLVLTNTLFNADKKETHDTYSLKSFKELQNLFNLNSKR